MLTSKRLEHALCFNRLGSGRMIADELLKDQSSIRLVSNRKKCLGLSKESCGNAITPSV